MERRFFVQCDRCGTEATITVNKPHKLPDNADVFIAVNQPMDYETAEDGAVTNWGELSGQYKCKNEDGHHIGNMSIRPV